MPRVKKLRSTLWLTVVWLMVFSGAAVAEEFQRIETIPDGTALVPIPVTTAWTATGVFLQEGDVVVVSADGIASTEYPPSRLYNWVGPEGEGYLADNGFGLLTQHSLIGKIGENGTPFQVGRGMHGIAMVAGQLYLGYNDGVFSDNYGYYLAYILVQGAGTAAAVVDPPALQTMALGQNLPNPFSPSTQIPFSLAAQGRVELTVHDVQGRVVRRLVSQEMGAGQHEVAWDGRDESGVALPPGSYLSALRVNGVAAGTRKTVLLSR